MSFFFYFLQITQNYTKLHKITQKLHKITQNYTLFKASTLHYFYLIYLFTRN